LARSLEWACFQGSIEGHHPFAMLKHQLGDRKVRYRGLERNAIDVCLMLTACNLKRALWLGSRSAGIGVDPVPNKA